MTGSKECRRRLLMHKRLNFTNNRSIKDTFAGNWAFYKERCNCRNLQEMKRESQFFQSARAKLKRKIASVS